MITEKNKDKLLKAAEDLNAQGDCVKVVKIGSTDKPVYFALRPIDMENWIKIKSNPDLGENFDVGVMKEHMVSPTYEEWMESKPLGGHFDKLKDALLRISGFTDDFSVVYDPTKMEYTKDPGELIDELKGKYENFKVILIDGISVAMTPIEIEEYMNYKAQTEKVAAVPDDEERLREAFKLDLELVKSHLIYPDKLFSEGIYVDVLFQLLWTISGFTDNVEVIES